MTQQRLPIVDGDDGQWGDILNKYIEKEHYNTGVDNAANGGHMTITLRPGTTSVGTAPIKLSSGPVMNTPEVGAIEFDTDKLYFTQTTGAIRNVIATYDDMYGAKGDVYYRDENSNFVRLPIGSSGEVLRVASGLPTWDTVPASGSSGEVQFNDSNNLSSDASFTFDHENSRVVIGSDAVVLPDNPLALAGNTNGYFQTNIQNKNSGILASSDYVATADDGDDEKNYGDFGICNSGFADDQWDVTAPHDTYLYGDGGNIVIGTFSPSKTVKLFIANTEHEGHPEDVIAEVDSDGINLTAGKTFRVDGVPIDSSEEGEANTASNIGTSGVGVFDSKSLVDLQFKNIVAGTSKINISDNPTDHTIEVDLGSVSLADLSDDSTHRVVTDAEKSTWDAKQPAMGEDDNYVTDAEKTLIGNTSGTNTGDQVADGATITGSGAVGDPFVAAAYSDQGLDTTDSPSFVDVSIDDLSVDQNIITTDSIKTSIQELDDNAHIHYAGVGVAPSFHDNEDGSVTIGAGSYHLYDNELGTGYVRHYDIAGDTFELTNNKENYMYADYHSGAPQLSVTLNRSVITYTDKVPVFTIFRAGTELIVTDWDSSALALAEKSTRRNVLTNRFQIQTAPILGEQATRRVTVESGIIWIGSISQSVDTFNSTTDELILLHHVLGVWTQTNITQYDNTQYDDGEDLQTLTDGNYSVGYYYREVSTKKRVYVVLGSDDYDFDHAQASVAPGGLPDYISIHCVLIGRILILKGASVATQIDSAFDTVFSSLTVSDHNSLSNRDVIGNHQRLVPVADNDTAIQFTKADGTPVINIDTLNNGVYISGEGTPPSVAVNAKFNAWDTADNWVQMNIQNLSDGTSASSDIAAVSDIGDDTNHFIDMGILGSKYSDEGWTISGPSDGYMYVAGGNLSIGSDLDYADIFIGGYLEENIIGRFSSAGLNVNGDITADNLSGENTGDQTKIANIIGGNSTTELGSIPYQSDTDTTTLLNPNTTTTKKFLRQTGTGTNGAAPVWDTLDLADVPTMTATTGGLVPTPPNNTTTFLRGDGTFAAASGSGLSQQQIMAISSLRI